MATPAQSDLDPAVQRYVDMAQAVGWQIKANARSISVVSPDGGRISLPLKSTEALLQVADGQAERTGLIEAFEELQREKADAALERELAGLADEEPEGEPEDEEASEPQPETGEYPCPECGQPCATPQGLGAHRRSHGVRGSSSAKIAKIDPETLASLQTAFDLFEGELLSALATLAQGGDDQKAEKATRAAEKAARDLETAREQLRDLKADLRRAERFKQAVKKALHENTPLTLAGAIAALDPHFFGS